MWKQTRRHAVGSGVTLLAGCLVLLLLPSTAAATSPTEFIKKHSKEVTTLLQQGESPQRAQKFSRKAEELIDFRMLASRALDGHWDKRSDNEKDQFLDLLQKLLEANYKKKLEGYKLGEDYEIEYLNEKTRGSRGYVQTKVVWGESEKKRKTVDFRMVKKGGSWVIYDIEIDGAGLEKTYREAYTKIIREDGWDALIEKMKKKIRKLRGG